MKFSGRLQIEADPRNWLKTELDLSQGRLELVSGGELLGSWSTGQVKAERLEGDRFQLELGADRAVFAADDALAFSYEALPALAKKSVLAAATGLRGKFRKGITGADRAAAANPDSDRPGGNHRPVPEPVEVHYREEPLSSSIASPPTRRLRELIQEAVKNNAADAAAQGQSIHWKQPPAPAPDVAEAPGSDLDEREAGDRPENSAVLHLAPVRAEPVRAEPVRPEPVRPEPARPEPARPEPARPEPARPEPARTEPARAEHARVQPGHVEMIDRVGALRPLFEVDRATTAAAEDPAPHPDATPLRPPETTSPETTSPETTPPETTPPETTRPVTIGPSEEVVKESFSPLRPAPEVSPSPGLRLTLDALIDEVRKGEMSPMQVIAVTDLVRAVAEAIEDRNRA